MHRRPETGEQDTQVLHEDDRAARRLGELLLARGWRIAVAETTAGGLIAARLLSVPGASAWFDRGVVCYGGRSKQELTGIDPAVLQTHGAVSREAVGAMAEGLRALAGVDITIAESGIAGPLGGRRSAKPVGSAVIAVATAAGTAVEEQVFEGTRVEVMGQIAARALDMGVLVLQD
jgi:PncC family amidohydrolase